MMAHTDSKRLSTVQKYNRYSRAVTNSLHVLLRDADTTVDITAELGKALAVVKVTSQVNGNPHFLGSGHPKTISAIKMKFGTIE